MPDRFRWNVPLSRNVVSSAGLRTGGGSHVPVDAGTT